MAIPIPIQVVSHSFPFPFPILSPIPITMVIPWDSHSHWESHSHGHLYWRCCDDNLVVAWWQCWQSWRRLLGAHAARRQTSLVSGPRRRRCEIRSAWAALPSLQPMTADAQQPDRQYRVINTESSVSQDLCVIYLLSVHFTNSVWLSDASRFVLHPGVAEVDRLYKTADPYTAK